MTGIEPAYSAWEVRLEGPAPFLRGSAYAPQYLTLFAALDRLALFASAPTRSALTFVPPRTSPQDDFVARGTSHRWCRPRRRPASPVRSRRASWRFLKRSGEAFLVGIEVGENAVGVADGC